MLTCKKKDFTGRLSCTYDRPYRLCGSWEASLISFTNTIIPVYILCDLIEYSHINQHHVQLLEYFFSKGSIKSNGRTVYTKLLNKRFRTINIDVKAQLFSSSSSSRNSQTTSTDETDWKNKIFAKTSAAAGDDEEVTCLIHFRRIG